MWLPKGAVHLKWSVRCGGSWLKGSSGAGAAAGSPEPIVSLARASPGGWRRRRQRQTVLAVAAWRRSGGACPTSRRFTDPAESPLGHGRAVAPASRERRRRCPLPGPAPECTGGGQPTRRETVSLPRLDPPARLQKLSAMLYRSRHPGIYGSPSGLRLWKSACSCAIQAVRFPACHGS